MAARSTTKTPEKPVQKPAVGTDLKALLKPSAGLPKVSRTREGGENPLSGAVQLDTPLQLPVVDTAQAKAVTALLRRDAADNNLGLRVAYFDKDGKQLFTVREKNAEGKETTVYPAGITSVHFVGKKKNAQKYTTADIRAWHKAQTGVEITGAVPADVRDAYRKAHGYAKDTKSA